MSFLVPESFDGGLAQMDLARSIASSITYIADRRIEHMPQVATQMEGEPSRLTFHSISTIPDRSLVAPLELEQNALDTALRQHLAKVSSLKDDDATAILAALDMHYGACLLFDRDISSAYTLLISGIETLSREFGQPPKDWEAWHEAAGWDEFILANCLDNTQASALKSRLLNDKQLRLTETFATYGAERLSESFWRREWRDWVFNVSMPDGQFDGGDWQPPIRMEALVPQDRAELKRSLKLSYTARSKFVHASDRVVNIVSDMRAHMTNQAKGALTFCGLRLVLRELISQELEHRHSPNARVPDVTFTIEG